MRSCWPQRRVDDPRRRSELLVQRENLQAEIVAGTKEGKHVRKKCGGELDHEPGGITNTIADQPVHTNVGHIRSPRFKVRVPITIL
jgi:hypothetical protein